MERSRYPTDSSSSTCSKRLSRCLLARAAWYPSDWLNTVITNECCLPEPRPSADAQLTFDRYAMKNASWKKFMFRESGRDENVILAWGTCSVLNNNCPIISTYHRGTPKCKLYQFDFRLERSSWSSSSDLKIAPERRQYDAMTPCVMSTRGPSVKSATSNRISNLKANIRWMEGFSTRSPFGDLFLFLCSYYVYICIRIGVTIGGGQLFRRHCVISCLPLLRHFVAIIATRLWLWWTAI